MLRYDLDKLGWYEFEYLCQVLLKHKLGLGIEAWGGTKDWGRDAYYEGELNYPTKRQVGPFLFQCKFVNGANFAGARNDNLIMNAVKAECKSIKKKLSNTNVELSKTRRKRKWDNTPKIYTFMSNAILRPPLRKKVEACVKTVLPDCTFVKQDGKDICAMIDLTTGITRRFPQILSLNDLEILLSDCVNNNILNRSEAAIEEAKEISKVFVPTEAYAKALSVLHKIHYVVLEGPPEVGKTAIARMIALSYIPEGWEAIECQEPNDFLRKHKKNRRQIFVVDDSFGRTEYKPDRVSLWQDDLPSILRKINKHHLLILTSRKHLLEMAKDKLDIPGVNSDFPLPAEVLVDVSSLTKLEKTLMLYKHMKNAGLTKAQKILVRGSARDIIGHRGFTPERIRELTRKTKGISCTPALITETFRNPTNRMSKTYRELPAAHKWFMISVLLNPSYLFSSTDQIKSLYEVLCPSEEMLNFNKIKTQLSEAFIKTVMLSDKKEVIDWIHPSCGDMVAIELSDNPKDRIHFLNHCDVSGLKYAVSVGGGFKGSKILPVLKSPKDWEVFKRQCNKYLNITLINNMFDSIQQLSKSKKHNKEKQLLENVLKEVVLKAIKHFNEKGWQSKELIVVFKIIKNYPDIQLANIKYKEGWFQNADSVMEILENDYTEWHSYTDINDFVSLTKIIIDYNPNLFDNEKVNQKWKDVVETFQRRGGEESLTYICDPETNLAEKLYDSYDSSKRIFEELANMVINEKQNAKFIKIRKNFNALIEYIVEYIPPEPDDYDRYGEDDLFYNHSDEYSLEKIFKDL